MCSIPSAILISNNEIINNGGAVTFLFEKLRKCRDITPSILMIMMSISYILRVLA
jgi:hypothetical protein